MKKYRLKQNMTCDQEIILSDDESLPAEFFEEIKDPLFCTRCEELEAYQDGKCVRCLHITQVVKPPVPSRWIDKNIGDYSYSDPCGAHNCNCEYLERKLEATIKFLDEHFKK